MKPEDAAMLQACRLALAVAEQDEDAVRGVIEEAAQTPAGPTLLLTTLAGTCASLMQEKAGTNWRAALLGVIQGLEASGGN